MSKRSVAIEEGIPTVKTERTFSVLGSPFESRKRRTVSVFCLRIVTVKKAHAQQFEISVATPTPSTSYPLGNNTNMNSGSSIIFNTPPIAIPNPAFPDSPTLRSRFAITFERTVGIPPSTMTQKEYWAA